MRKTRRLMDNNSASFSNVLNSVAFTAVGCESQISMDQMTLYSSNVEGIPRYLLRGGSMRRSPNVKMS